MFDKPTKRSGLLKRGIWPAGLLKAIQVFMGAAFARMGLPGARTALFRLSAPVPARPSAAESRTLKRSVFAGKIGQSEIDRF